ncbi:MAG: tRNA lysidine(34) synthetase TilS [Polyangiaceae bacterium]|nr:tRNA lysidine(34) synthetase TilS [Polyangiaceae bacterium]
MLRRVGKRTHPPSLVRLAERTLREAALVRRDELVLCACSGGADSQALCDVLAHLRARLGHEVLAVGVDHGLRAEAALELDLAAALARRHGVPFERCRVEVAPGGNLQARARAARLAALEAVARRTGAAAIATGHTADDRAETVLLRLLRGAGPGGLAVLPPRATSAGGLVLVRPLVAARRADVSLHLARHGVPFASDPSNADARFLRVRVRRELLPLLEALSPRIVAHLCDLADMLAADADEARAVSADVTAALGSAPAVLGRAQRLAIDRAQRLGRPAITVRLSGGRDLRVALSPARGA